MTPKESEPRNSEPKGRGAAHNPNNRFARHAYSRDPELEWDDAVLDEPSPRTEILWDTSRSIIARNDSPDVPFTASVNPYRGCEHGCAYCYARPTHEYLGFSAGLDFETKIVAKRAAAELLRSELRSKHWRPQALALSGVTDPYQPVERSLRLTRACLEVLAEARNPVLIITKSDLVLRDIDLLAELARHDAVSVGLSVTSLDREIARRLEPRACQPRRRLAAVARLTEAGIPATVLVAPVIPALNDHEIPAIVSAAAAAGARGAGLVLLRLPHGLRELFEDWLECAFPEKREKVLARIRATRDGELNDPRFGSRMRGEGAVAQTIRDMFNVACRRAGFSGTYPQLSTASFRTPAALGPNGERQLSLFDEDSGSPAR